MTTLTPKQATPIDLTADETIPLPAVGEDSTDFMLAWIRSNNGEHTATFTGAAGGDVSISAEREFVWFVPSTQDGAPAWFVLEKTGPPGADGETPDVSNISLTSLDFDSAVADDAVASASQTVNLDRTTGKLSYDFEITQSTTLTYTNGEKSQGGEDTIWNDSGSTQTVTIAVGTGLTRLLGTPPTEIANNKKLVISRRVIANTPGSGLALFVNFQEADI